MSVVKEVGEGKAEDQEFYGGSEMKKKDLVNRQECFGKVRIRNKASGQETN
jgi:hypothetical protein